MVSNPHPFAITPLYDKLLRGSRETPVGLYHLGLATAEQLTRLHYSPASLTHVKEHLKALRDHGYALHGAIPTTRRGAPYYYYTLGPHAVRYLASLGYDVSEGYRPAKEVDKSWLFLKHSLELNDVVISAALLRGTVSLGSFATDRTLKGKPLVVRAQGKTMRLVPDAVLAFRAGDDRRRILIEHDRGTEGQAHFRARIRAYIAYLHTERLPVVFTTFEGERRREHLRAWTKAEVDGAALPFWFAAFECPPSPAVWISPVWYAAYDGPPQALLGE